MGEKAFHEQSHGQAFHDLLAARGGRLLTRGGLLVLDEPEAGLSFSSQLELVHQLGELVSSGVQVLLAVHPPVVEAIPGALILQVEEKSFAPAVWEELEQVGLYRRFLASPSSFSQEDGSGIQKGWAGLYRPWRLFTIQGVDRV